MWLMRVMEYDIRIRLLRVKPNRMVGYVANGDQKAEDTLGNGSKR